MKRFVFIAFLILANQAFASGRIIDDQQNSSMNLPSVKTIKVKQESVFGDFFFKPSLSIEYSAPRFLKSGVNSDSKSSGTIFRQIGDINNFAIGGNFRVHKYLGFNANWAQGTMLNSELQGQGALSGRAQFSFDQYNLSALFYVPAIENFFEIFAEGGVTDFRSKLKYGAPNGAAINEKSHDTLGFYGAGFQFKLNEKDAIRVSWQRYCGRIALMDSQYSTMRIGYLMAF